MHKLYLDDHGTDRDRFVAYMLAIKARNPEAYAVVREQMLAFVGDAHPTAEERADLVRRFKAVLKEGPTADRLVAELERHLAEGAAS